MAWIGKLKAYSEGLVLHDLGPATFKTRPCQVGDLGVFQKNSEPQRINHVTLKINMTKLAVGVKNGFNFIMSLLPKETRISFVTSINPKSHTKKIPKLLVRQPQYLSLVSFC